MRQGVWREESSVEQQVKSHVKSSNILNHRLKCILSVIKVKKVKVKKDVLLLVVVIVI